MVLELPADSHRPLLLASPHGRRDHLPGLAVFSTELSLIILNCRVPTAMLLQTAAHKRAGLAPVGLGASREVHAPNLDRTPIEGLSDLGLRELRSLFVSKLLYSSLLEV